MVGFLSSPGFFYDEFRRLQDELDELFGGWPSPVEIRAAGRGAYPAVNVGSTPEQVNVYVFAAGLDPKSLDLSLQQNVLTISGERNAMTEEGANYYRRERFDGAFRRAIALPDDVDPEQVEASYRDGILQVTVKRREAARPRRIEVQ